MHRTVAAVLLCAVIAIPSADARPLDPFAAFLVGIGKAFAPQKIKPRRHVARPTTHEARSAERATGKQEPAPSNASGNASGNVVLPDDRALRDLAAIYARQNGIDPRLGVALIEAESNFDPWATGAAGEIGLGQIMYGTAIDLGYAGTRRGLYHVGTNLRYAMLYLARAKARSGGSQCGMLSRYNAGLYSAERRPDYCRRVAAAMH